MRLDELFGLFGKDPNALSTEEKALAIKAKGMYTKSIDNFEKIIEKNAQAFDTQPLKAFNQWFEYVFDKNLDQMMKTREIKITDKNISEMAKPLIALASLNYYLKPKTPVQGFEALVKLGPRIFGNDKTILTIIDKSFGKFLERGSNANEKDTDAKPKKGTTYKTKEGTFTWLGAMWVDEKQQPGSKQVQATLTQLARDEGKTE